MSGTGPRGRGRGRGASTPPLSPIDTNRFRASPMSSPTSSPPSSPPSSPTAFSPSAPARRAAARARSSSSPVVIAASSSQFGHLESREFHFCTGWNRIFFIPESTCTKCKEKPPAQFHPNGRMLRKQEGHNYFARPNFVGEGQLFHQSDEAIRIISTQNFIEHAVQLINLTRPERGGHLTPHQAKTMREIRDIGDWNRFGCELLTDATRYGLVHVDTGELACFFISYRL
jgi:hypothetical protein